MTTNVFDGNVGLLATDSRWSIAFGRRLIYVDDAQFDKIERYQDAVFMFAGKGDGVQAWKDWIRSGPVDASAMPQPEGITVCIVDAPTKSLRYTRGQHIKREGALFAGSGSIYAVTCWTANKDAKRSVTTAATVDKCTGGEVKFFDCASGQNNLNYPHSNVTIAMVKEAVLQRGMVMDITAGQPAGVPFSLKQLAANDGELQELQAKIANGEVSPEAPCPGAYSEWTEDEKTELKVALAEVFGWKG